jgi:hypothetical protein
MWESAEEAAARGAAVEQNKLHFAKRQVQTSNAENWFCEAVG